MVEPESSFEESDEYFAESYFFVDKFDFDRCSVLYLSGVYWKIDELVD